MDVVYTWVKQPSQEEYEKIARDCPGLAQAGGWQRFRNLNTFRFSLRMLEQNMPWVRNIFIVTPGGEVPDWLNTDNPKIHVISQEDLWTNEEKGNDWWIHNSQPVEVRLHRIPGLAAHFVYFNDDMFVGRSVEKSFFFTDDGKPVLHVSQNDLDWNSGQRGPDWCHAAEPAPFPMTNNTHMPGAHATSLIDLVQSRWPDQFDAIARARCRGDIRNDWGPFNFYQWFGALSGLMAVREPVKTGFLNDKIKSKHAWYHEMLSDPPYIACINDDFEVNNHARFVAEKNDLMAFLALMSIQAPSSFVKHTRFSKLALDKQDGIAVSLIEQSSIKSL